MSRPVILTACINGGRPDAAQVNSGLPVTPKQIARAVAEASALGAAVAHLHVRDPATGLPSNDLALWRETVGLIREMELPILLNLSASMDGLLLLEDEAGFTPAKASTLRRAEDRVAHVLTLTPEIGTIDCGTFALGDAIHVARDKDLQHSGQLYRQAGVLAEVECFDFGHLEIARRLAKDGFFGPQPFVQICLGTGYGGAPATPAALTAMIDRIPAGAIWAAFAAGQDNQWLMPLVLAAGGHIRAGLEDCLLNADGTPACNAALLAGACAAIAASGNRPASVEEARVILDLPPQNMRPWARTSH